MSRLVAENLHRERKIYAAISIGRNTRKIPIPPIPDFVFSILLSHSFSVKLIGVVGHTSVCRFDFPYARERKFSLLLLTFLLNLTTYMKRDDYEYEQQETVS